MTMDCTLVMGLLSVTPLPGRLIELALLCSGWLSAGLHAFQLIRMMEEGGVAEF